MRYRDPKKESDLFSMIDHQQSVLKAVKGINKLNAVIDWELFREELESILGYENRDPKGERSPSLRCGADAPNTWTVERSWEWYKKFGKRKPPNTKVQFIVSPQGGRIKSEEALRLMVNLIHGGNLSVQEFDELITYTK